MTTCAHTDATTARRCRMPVSPNETLCGAHSASSTRCPECGTPIRATLLQRHLSKPLCPVLKQRLQTTTSSYYHHDVNLARNKTPIPQSQPRITDLTPLLARLQPPNPGRAPRALPEDGAIRRLWGDQRNNSLKMEPKHFTQISALSSLLLTPPPEALTNIVELAAGRGYTSLYLAHILDLRQISSSVTTIDRAPTRYKADRTLRKWVSQKHHSLQSFQRIRIDLQHLDLSPILPSTPGADIRIVAKHACGQALDLALTACTNLARGCRGRLVLVFASCCRNRCSFHVFGDGGRVWRLWGVSELLFGQICKASLWGLDEKHDKDKAEIGRRCRLLIDYARVEWLNSVGWNAYVTTYTDASPENACIVAVWKGVPRNTEQDKDQKLTSAETEKTNFTKQSKAQSVDQ